MHNFYSFLFKCVIKEIIKMRKISYGVSSYISARRSVNVFFYLFCFFLKRCLIHWCSINMQKKSILDTWFLFVSLKYFKTTLRFFLSVISFHLEVANRYKLNKKLRKIQAKLGDDPENISMRNAVSRAKVSRTAKYSIQSYTTGKLLCKTYALIILNSAHT